MFTTPITVVIDAEFEPLSDPNIVAEDSSTGILIPYNYLYSLMVASATPETSVVSRVPTAQQLGAYMPYDPSNPSRWLGQRPSVQISSLGIPDAKLPGNQSIYNPA